VDFLECQRVFQERVNALALSFLQKTSTILFDDFAFLGRIKEQGILGEGLLLGETEIQILGRLTEQVTNFAAGFIGAP